MSDNPAKRISALVKNSGLSVRELGRRIGVSNVSIGKWMRGAFLPSGKALFPTTPSHYVLILVVCYILYFLNKRRTISQNATSACSYFFYSTCKAKIINAENSIYAVLYQI